MKNRNKYKNNIAPDKVGYKRKSRINLPVVNRIMTVLIIVLFGGFLIATNDLSIKGFVLSEMKLKLSDLEKNNQKLQLQVMELQSYDNIDKKARARNMVKVDKIEYISLAKEEVAKK